jgi:large subunit ribosomal protein L25
MKNSLKAKIREKKDTRALFSKMIPAVLYGPEIKNQVIWIDKQEFKKILKEIGESTLIDLKLEKGKDHPVLIQDIQYNALNNDYQHIDFFKVNMKEEIETDVELEFVGESEAVKNEGGILVKNINAIRIRCLPNNLLSEIEVDLSILKKIDDKIYVKNLSISDKVKVDLEPETVVAVVTPPRSTEELEALEEKDETDIDQVEGIKEEEEGETSEKPEGEEGEEKSEEKPDETPEKKEEETKK